MAQLRGQAPAVAVELAIGQNAAAHALRHAHEEDVPVAAAAAVEALRQDGTLVVVVKEHRQVVALLDDLDDLYILDAEEVEGLEDHAVSHTDGAHTGEADGDDIAAPLEDGVQELVDQVDQLLLVHALHGAALPLEDPELQVAENRLAAVAADGEAHHLGGGGGQVQAHRPPAQLLAAGG